MPSDDIMGKMGLDISNFEKQIQLAIKSLDKLNQTSSKTDARVKNIEAGANVAAKALSGLSKVAGLLGFGFGASQLLNFGKSLLSFSKNIDDSSRSADLGAESYQRVKSALQNFVSADDASSAISDLSKTLREAREGSVEAIEKLDALGVSMDEIQDPATNAKTLVEKLSTNYVNAADKTEYLQRASAIFGDDLARKLVPALEVGGQKLHEMGGAATVASDATIKAGKEGELAMERWGMAVKEWSLYAIGWWDNLIKKTFQYISVHKKAVSMFIEIASQIPGLGFAVKTGKKIGDSFSTDFDDQQLINPAIPKKGSNKSNDLKPDSSQGFAAPDAGASGGGVSYYPFPFMGSDSSGGGGTSSKKDPVKQVKDYKDAVKDVLPAMKALAEAESKRTLGMKYQLDAMEAQKRLLNDQALIAERAGKTNEAAALRSQISGISLEGLEMRAAQHDLSPREKAAQFNEQRKRERSLRAQARREMQSNQAALRNKGKLGGLTSDGLTSGNLDNHNPGTTSSDYLQPGKAFNDTMNSYLNQPKGAVDVSQKDMSVATLEVKNFSVPNK